MNQTAYKLGIQGENIAISLLNLNNYHILQTRYRSPYGEIDIIAQYDNIIVCVEVKTRSSIESGLYAIRQDQQGRIMNTYLYFIQSNPSYANCDVRFDAIVCCPGYQPHHVENAFEGCYA